MTTGAAPFSSPETLAFSRAPRGRWLMTAPRGVVTQLAENLWIIDTLFRGEVGVIASYLLAGPGGLALIDVGSAATLAQLLAGVRAAGFDPNAIESLVLTHIHLDHAGASGALIEMLPRAQVYVHAIGAAHLIDPSRLIRSAARIYGDEMDMLWGEIKPVPAERLIVASDGALLPVGNQRLRARYTPGHAIHHMALQDEASGAVFMGDLAGVRLAPINYVRPPTPPPDLDLEAWNASLDGIEAARPTRLYLAHFGVVERAGDHIHTLRQRLGEWGAIALDGMRAGHAAAQIASSLEAASSETLRRAATGAEEDALARYEHAANYLMSAQGYMRYYQTRHPELLA